MNIKQKVVSLPVLKKKIAQLRRSGKKIAFTNGCFDILHLGHVTYLEQAKKNGRALIVGVNSDSSVRRIKGKQRPIVPQQARAAVLAALTSVDYVVIFTEDTPLKTIQAIKPDILIKGADWKGKEVIGSDIVGKNGGKVEFIKYIPQNSTTNIIDNVLKKCRH